MMLLLLIGSTLASPDRPTAGARIDPIAGETVTARDRDLLPSGHNLGELSDLWFASIVNQQDSDGGIGAFDPLRLSSHGRSWTLLRHTLNGLSIDDPGRPGSPVIDLPYSSWDTLTYQSLWTATPGFSATIGATPGPRPTRAWLRGSLGNELGGPSLVPRNFMNRDPATDAGASPIRRKLRLSRELEGQVTVGTETFGARLIYEHRDQDNRYPTLVSDSDGRRIDDSSQRDTIMAVGELSLGGLPVSAIAALQKRSRSHEGAEFRLPSSYTQSTEGESYLLQLGTSGNLTPTMVFDVAVGVSYRNDVASQNSDRPIITDIEREWLWLQRPTPAEHLTRTSIDLNAGVAWDAALPVELRLTGNQSFLRRRARFAGDVTATTYERSDLDRSRDLTVYEPPARGEEWLRSLRLQGDARHDMGGITLRGMLAMDHAAVGVSDGPGVSFWTPAVGVAASHGFANGGELFTLLRREPDRLTAEVARFLDPAVGNGERYAWNDNGDLQPSADEAGSLQARTGGRYHTVDPNLARPTSNQFAIGWLTPRFGPFRAVMTGTLRFHLDAFVARLNGAAENSYQQTAFFDPGGDGRGEDILPGGGQSLAAYERVPGTEGQELYRLENRLRDNRFIGAELQLVSVEADEVGDRRPWFLNLTAAGYWDVGSGTFGAFPDRNDPGVVNESSADPNARVNDRGRFDHDRAFSIKCLAGLTPIDGLTLSTAIRYRDGQPFSRIVVAELAQGPTPIMATWRGAARHTFHMTADVKIRWASRIKMFDYAISGEVYNLFQQSLELLEDPRTGRVFRRAIEMTPGRTGFVTLELGLQ